MMSLRPIGGSVHGVTRSSRACPDLGTPAAIANPGEDAIDPLRVIVTHMIEETARHAGHADILREQIDGVTND